jgi:hypothetical protein
VAPSLARSALVLALLLACDGDEPPSHRAAPAVPLDEGAFERQVGTIERVAAGTPSSPLRRPIVAEPEHGYELAIQGGRLVESLGFEGADAEFVPLLNSGSSLPAVGRESFSTIADDQPSIQLYLLAAADDTRDLGMLEIVDIIPARRGVPVFEVVFEVDAQGRISIEVVNADTGAPQLFVVRWGAQPVEDAIAEPPIPMCSELATALFAAMQDGRSKKRKKKRKPETPPVESWSLLFPPDAMLRQDLGLDESRIREVLIAVLDPDPQPGMPLDEFLTVQDLVDEACPYVESPR